MKNQYVYKKIVQKCVIIIADYTVKDDDFCLLVDATAGDIDITIPDQSTIKGRARDWRIKRFDGSGNRIRIRLANANDSMFGPTFNTTLLPSQGQGITFTLHANDKYSFADRSGTTLQLPIVQVSTISVDETAGILSMLASLDDFGAWDSLDVYFEYRDITAGDTARTATTPQTVTTLGNFSDTATVTTGNKIKARAVAEDANGSKYYGAEKQVNGPIYLSIADAKADGLLFYLPLQETAGTNTQGQEVVDGEDMDFFNGVTVASDTIGGNTIYKRVFGASDYGESAYTPPINSSDLTVYCQIEARLNNQDRSYWHFGANTLSLAGDGTNLQLSVNGTIQNLAGQLSMANIEDHFTVVDTGAGNTTSFRSTSTTDTQLLQITQTPNSPAKYTRLARGATGDNNQQDNEYLTNGDIRSYAIRGRSLSATERQTVAKCGEQGYLLIEGL